MLKKRLLVYSVLSLMAIVFVVYLLYSLFDFEFQGLSCLKY